MFFRGWMISEFLYFFFVIKFFCGVVLVIQKYLVSVFEFLFMLYGVFIFWVVMYMSSLLYFSMVIVFVKMEYESF